MIFKDTQAPLKSQHRSPVTPDLLPKSRSRNEVEPPSADTLEISSLFSKKPMTFKGTLNHAPIKILIDSGAMGNFVSKQAVDRFSFALSDVSNIPVVFMNGATGACNKAALAAYLQFENHDENIDLRVVSLPHHDIILGQPWLEKWNPDIDWKKHTINFDKPKPEQTNHTPSDPEPTHQTSTMNQVQLSLISHQQLNQALDPTDQLFLCEIS